MWQRLWLKKFSELNGSRVRGKREFVIVRTRSRFLKAEHIDKYTRDGMESAARKHLKYDIENISSELCDGGTQGTWCCCSSDMWIIAIDLKLDHLPIIQMECPEPIFTYMFTLPFPQIAFELSKYAHAGRRRSKLNPPNERASFYMTGSLSTKLNE